jgi:hypothetical protein
LFFVLQVCGLDAALRALQHTQAEQPSATGCISQLENQQQQQAADSPSLAVVTADVEQQQQLPTLNLHVEAQTLSAEAPAAQKAAGQLLPHSEQLTLEPVAPQQDELVEVSTPARPSTKQTGHGSTASTATHLMATPLVVPVHALGGQQLLQELARWQVQQGLAPAEATVSEQCAHTHAYAFALLCTSGVRCSSVVACLLAVWGWTTIDAAWRYGPAG